jgi:hypothetical protein
VSSVRVELRPIRRGRLFRRKAAPEVLGETTLGPEFFAVLARVPPGWTRTLDALPSAGPEGVVFGRLEARMAATELSRISPYAESPDEQAAFTRFRELVNAVTDDRELTFLPGGSASVT